jgi:hypothetical protein
MKVIVIDDERNRREAYEVFRLAVSEFMPGIEVAFDYVDNPNQIPFMMRRHQYAAAIVDAVLWPDYPITKALQDLADDIPIALLSDRWDDTNAEQMTEVLKKPKCRTFLHWRDIDPDREGQIDYAIRAFTAMVADSLQLDVSLRLGADDSIRILHISDLQTGGADNKMLRLEANRCADHIREHWQNRPPTFVAFTGDVTEHGDLSQYNSSLEWITYFFARLGLNGPPTRQLLYVPGNHDVNLRLAASARVQILETKLTQEIELKLEGNVQQPELLAYAYIPFRNFLTKITDCPLLLQQDPNDYSLAWVESRYRQHGVIFYGINTAQPANAFGPPARRVDPDALARIGVELNEVVNECNSSDTIPPMVVGMGHHCPVSANDDSAVENPDDFDKFFGGGVKTALFLHGHRHKHELSYTSSHGLRLVRSCATTLTKREPDRPTDSLRGFNLLELGRRDHAITELKAFSFGWLGNELKELGKGEWKREDDGMFLEGGKK